eukprot:TRINITY_DN150_c1_g1_i1.p1 TRINITY_DN150_c1_g1~~TRINITY_DN150_c1_g1_i1.p1  ORF type:complete len:739 (+),score=280.76 TRINITY_DN150_c1_g1_i1:1-2217(+)
MKSIKLVALLLLASLVVISCDGTKQEEAKVERHAFQTEVSKLMSLLVHSLYTDRSVFLRELISNASDALDKIRILLLSSHDSKQENKLEIKIRYDEEKGILEITDTGVGMTKSDLEKNLGTIAHSGTTEFFKNLESAKDASAFIGQFGVGFYSAFLVADTVTVTSKSDNDTDQWIWESNADTEYTLARDPQGNTLGRGTKIALHLKEEAKEFANPETLKNIVRKYSEFINFPIYVWSSREETVPVEEEKKEEKKETEEEEIEEEKTEEKKDEKKTTKKTVWEWELVNTVKPLWTRNPKDIEEQEYNAFYKSITKDNEDPLLKSHFIAEGEVNFRSILYVPKTAPSSTWDPNPLAHKQSLKLYVRRVFITSDFYNIIPSYLRFIRGIVDSDDLPLNVAREQLQESKILDTIKSKIVRKAIAMFQELFKNDQEKYQQFWEQYGPGIKIGAIEDFINRDRLAKIMIFHSSHSENMTSLDDYVSRMKKGQKDIYYVAGDSVDQLRRSPVAERLLKNGFEVLFLTHPVDEYTMSHLGSYNKIKLTNLAREGDKLEFIDDEKEKNFAEQAKKVVEYMKNVLGDKVEKVIVSHKLATSPSALVANSWGYTANMEKMQMSQPTRAGTTGNKVKGMTRRILEINPSHPIIKSMAQKLENQDVASVKDEDLELSVKVLYESAVVSGGYIIDSPADFAQTMHQLLAVKMGVNPQEKVEVVDLEKPLKEEEGAEKEAEKEEKKEERKEEL